MRLMKPKYFSACHGAKPPDEVRGNTAISTIVVILYLECRVPCNSEKDLFSS